MKPTPAILLAALVLVVAGCQTSAELLPISRIQPSIAEQGSLANAKLIADTTAALKKALGSSVINPQTKILKFVIQKPVGEPGSRAWREMWYILNAEKISARFIITFREDGLHAANFEIRQM
ncbi:MAG: hypothetical protein L0I62_06470 [Gammaproteobacteria bacterium]|nr:hypothetical protein [Gammaproteobacteria bacterium]